MEAGDAIVIHGLDLPVRIGVPDEERAGLQTLQADVTLVLQKPFDAMRDELAETVDYEAVANRVKSLAAERPRKLVETLAAEIVRDLLANEAIAAVEVELRKRILPGVDHVAVRMRRARA